MIARCACGMAVGRCVNMTTKCRGVQCRALQWVSALAALRGVSADPEMPRRSLNPNTPVRLGCPEAPGLGLGYRCHSDRPSARHRDGNWDPPGLAYSCGPGACGVLPVPPRLQLGCSSHHGERPVATPQASSGHAAALGSGPLYL